MADQKQNKRLSKIIDYMLDKAPDEFGLLPDEDGFVKVKDLLQALHEEDGWRHVRQATLNELVLTLPEVSFEIIDNRVRSRHRTGPSSPVIADPPPRLLYTCIRPKAYPHVLQKGLSPSAHSQVVLAADKILAEKIGKRKGPDPVTLTVLTDEASAQGVLFYRSGENLYLADFIPQGCFSGPALPKEREKKAPKERIDQTTAVPAEGTRIRAGTFIPEPGRKTGGADGQRAKKKKDADWKRERKKRNRNDSKQWPG